MTGQGESAQDISARDDAHLQSLGHQAAAEPVARVPRELRAGVQLHQRLDRVVRQLRRRLRPRRAADVLDLADHRRRPVPRRPRLRRAGQSLPGRRLDLPVVEAPVAPDAGLVHRLVLLLGPGRDGHRGRLHRRLRGRRDHGPRRTSWRARRRSASATCSRSSRSRRWSSRRSSTRSASGSWRSSTTSASATEILGHARLRAHPAVLREPPVARRPDPDVRRGAGAERQHAGDLRARLLHVDLHPVRLRHRRHVRRGDASTRAARRRAASCRRSWSRAPSASSSCWRSSSRSRTSRRRWPTGLAGAVPDRHDDPGQPDVRDRSAASRSARSTCSSSSRRSSSARWRSRARRPG